MSSETEVLLNVPRTESIGDRKLALTPFVFEELHLVAEIGKPLITLLASGAEQNPAQMLKDHAGAVVDLCSVLSRQDRAWVASLPAGQMIKLFNLVIEVNNDFFTDGVIGLIEMARMFGWLPTKSSSPTPSPSPSQDEPPPTPSAPGPDLPTS